MALLSFAGSPHGGALKLLPEWKSQPRITPTAIIDHSIVGSGIGAWLMFRDRSGLESHFIVLGRRSGSKDGYIWQLMDTGRQADANLDANGYALSIETEDDGDPDHQQWTNAQGDSLIWLHRKLPTIHKSIPRRESSTCGNPAGHGFHTIHGAPSCWTPVSKSCPGTVRKQQWKSKLLPAYLSTAPLPGGDDMSAADVTAINKKIDDSEKEMKSYVDLKMRQGVRYVDHGDPEKSGASNNLEVVRKELAEIKRLLLLTAPPGS